MDAFIAFLNQQSFWWIFFAEILACYLALLGMIRAFGKSGLYGFIALMVAIANIQVNKQIFFPFYDEPVTLGTTAICATYLASDILAECFGKKEAQRAVWMGFAGMLILTVMMTLTLGFKPLSPNEATQYQLPQAPAVQAGLIALFSTSPTLLMASLSSFLLSQFVDISLFLGLKNLTHKRALWLRSILSTGLSGLLDNTVFNILAFRILSAHPIPWPRLIVGYIFGTYLVRLAISILDTPMIYFAKHQLKNKFDKMG